jgi:hypothetical protein
MSLLFAADEQYSQRPCELSQTRDSVNVLFLSSVPGILTVRLLCLKWTQAAGGHTFSAARRRHPINRIKHWRNSLSSNC